MKHKRPNYDGKGKSGFRVGHRLTLSDPLTTN
jgi:hypothetical protein